MHNWCAGDQVSGVFIFRFDAALNFANKNHFKSLLNRYVVARQVHFLSLISFSFLLTTLLRSLEATRSASLCSTCKTKILLALPLFRSTDIFDGAGTAFTMSTLPRSKC